MTVAPLVIAEQPAVPTRLRPRLRPVRAGLALALVALGVLLTAQPLGYVVAFAR
jgi:hypothetical protein